jgi:HD superfamily phosphohydrolase
MKIDQVLNDAVHGVMSFTAGHSALVRALVDTEDFQRLRHIKQLGLVDLIFPTALHNRFCHSLGAAFVAQRMAAQLAREDAFIAAHQSYAVAGALLHDIGHGPFSHAFEKLLVDARGQKIVHEEWTPFFLNQFASTLTKHGIEFPLLQELMQKKSATNTNQAMRDTRFNLISDIVSSQLDADRLDYLLRDSHFCGVTYGNTDIAWIIDNLTIAHDASPRARIGIRMKGYRAVEHFLLCRRIMNQNVYQHHKKYVFEQLLFYFLRAVSIGLFSDDKLFKSLVASPTLQKFLSACQLFHNGDYSAAQFMTENFCHYRRLTDYDIWMLIRDFSQLELTHASVSLAKKLYRREGHVCFFIHGYVDVVKTKLTELQIALKLANWQVFVTENRVQSYAPEQDPILVVDNTGRVLTLESCSDLLRAISGKQETEAFIAIDPVIWQQHQTMIISLLEDYVNFPNYTDKESKHGTAKTLVSTSR